MTAADPNLSAPPSSIDWKLVAVSGAVSLAVVGLFVLAIEHAGRAARHVPVRRR